MSNRKIRADQLSNHTFILVDDKPVFVVKSKVVMPNVILTLQSKDESWSSNWERLTVPATHTFKVVANFDEE